MLNELFPSLSIAQLVSEYGYTALAVGCLLEGETIVLLAGFAVHRGQLSWANVVLIATVCSFVGDQFWFQIGRQFGDGLLARFPSIASRRPWLEKRVFAHPDLVVLGVRFMVGLRTVGPILMGSGFAALFLAQSAGCGYLGTGFRGGRLFLRRAGAAPAA